MNAGAKHPQVDLTERLWEELEAALTPEARHPPLHLLFATDGSADAGAATQFLRSLPLPPGSRLTLLTVSHRDWEYRAGMKAALHEWAQRTAEQAAAELSWPGVEVTAVSRSGQEAHEIIEAADELQPDLVVAGSKGLSRLQEFLVGGVARNVARHARRPVLIARAPKDNLRRVILAIDQSEHAIRALRALERLPLPDHSEILVCHVVRPYYPLVGTGVEYAPALLETAEAVRREQHELAEQLVRRGRSILEHWDKHGAPIVLEGDPATELLALAEERGVDLIVTGARGVSLVEGLLLGSVADGLLRSTVCSVLVAH